MIGHIARRAFELGLTVGIERAEKHEAQELAFELEAVRDAETLGLGGLLSGLSDLDTRLAGELDRLAGSRFELTEFVARPFLDEDLSSATPRHAVILIYQRTVGPQPPAQEDNAG